MFPIMVGFPPKSSILIGISIINHPFWGTPIFGNTHINLSSGILGGGFKFFLMFTPKIGEDVHFD